MRCEEVRPLLSRGAEEGLDLRQSAGLQEHLAGCAGCRVEHDRLLTFLVALDPGNDAVAPSGFADRVMERVGRDAGGEGFFPPVVQLAFAVAMVVAFGAVALALQPWVAQDFFSRNYTLPVAEIHKLITSARGLVEAVSGSMGGMVVGGILAALVLVNLFLGIRTASWDRGDNRGR